MAQRSERARAVRVESLDAAAQDKRVHGSACGCGRIAEIGACEGLLFERGRDVEAEVTRGAQGLHAFGARACRNADRFVASRQSRFGEKAALVARAEAMGDGISDYRELERHAPGRRPSSARSSMRSSRVPSQSLAMSGSVRMLCSPLNFAPKTSVKS